MLRAGRQSEVVLLVGAIVEILVITSSPCESWRSSPVYRREWKADGRKQPVAEVRIAVAMSASATHGLALAVSVYRSTRR